MRKIFGSFHFGFHDRATRQKLFVVAGARARQKSRLEEITDCSKVY
jgi:hypothetical protein